jgi:hypothetical protein
MKKQSTLFRTLAFTGVIGAVVVQSCQKQELQPAETDGVKHSSLRVAGEPIFEDGRMGSVFLRSGNSTGSKSVSFRSANYSTLYAEDLQSGDAPMTLGDGSILQMSAAPAEAIPFYFDGRRTTGVRTPGQTGQDPDRVSGNEVLKADFGTDLTNLGAKKLRLQTQGVGTVKVEFRLGATVVDTETFTVNVPDGSTNPLYLTTTLTSSARFNGVSLSAVSGWFRLKGGSDPHSLIFQDIAGSVKRVITQYTYASRFDFGGTTYSPGNDSPFLEMGDYRSNFVLKIGANDVADSAPFNSLIKRSGPTAGWGTPVFYELGTTLLKMTATNGGNPATVGYTNGNGNVGVGNTPIDGQKTFTIEPGNAFGDSYGFLKARIAFVGRGLVKMEAFNANGTSVGSVNVQSGDAATFGELTSTTPFAKVVITPINGGVRLVRFGSYTVGQ